MCVCVCVCVALQRVLNETQLIQFSGPDSTTLKTEHFENFCSLLYILFSFLQRSLVFVSRERHCYSSVLGFGVRAAEASTCAGF